MIYRYTYTCKDCCQLCSIPSRCRINLQLRMCNTVVCNTDTPHPIDISSIRSVCSHVFVYSLQFLEEVCAKNSWPSPLYTVHSSYGTGENRLFVYKVGSSLGLAKPHPQRGRGSYHYQFVSAQTGAGPIVWLSIAPDIMTKMFNHCLSLVVAVTMVGLALIAGVLYIPTSSKYMYSTSFFSPLLSSLPSGNSNIYWCLLHAPQAE